MRTSYLCTLYRGCKRIQDQTDTAFCKNNCKELGIQPDVLVLRTEHELSANLLSKVALFSVM